MTLKDAVTFLFIVVPQSKAEAATDAVAVGAISSPLWLHQFTGIAQDLAVWLGVLWLATQIGWKWYRELKK